MAQTVMSDHGNALFRQERCKLSITAHVLVHAVDQLNPEFDCLRFCLIRQPLHTMQPGLPITGRQIKIPFLHILSSRSISAFHPELVTVQYPHSYGQKSIENCLRQWDFCLQAHVFIRSAQ